MFCMFPLSNVSHNSILSTSKTIALIIIKTPTIYFENPSNDLGHRALNITSGTAGVNRKAYVLVMMVANVLEPVNGRPSVTAISNSIVSLLRRLNHVILQWRHMSDTASHITG